MAYRVAISPFTDAGQKNLSLETLMRFAKDPEALAKAQTAELVPGSKPTLAEATGDPGLAQLQRSAQATSSEAASALAESKTARMAARKKALLDIAGDHDDRLMMEEARRATADESYGKAYEKGIDITRDPTSGQFYPKAKISGIKGNITTLLKAPAIQDAIKDAQELAANEKASGNKNAKYIDLKNMGGSVLGLDYVQRALGDRISRAVTTGDTDKARVLGGLRDRLLNTIDSLSPDYAAARGSYAEMSKPINRQQVGTYLYDKLFPAMSDLGAERLTPQSYAKALKDGDEMAKKATGFAGAKLKDVLSPQDMDTIINLGKDLGRETAAAERAKVPGSPTAQYLAAGNVMRQILGPLGMPESWTEFVVNSTLGKTVSSWGKPIFGVAEGRVQDNLGRMLADPQYAKDVAAAQAAPKMDSVKNLIDRTLRLAPVGGGATSAYAAQQ